MASAASPSFTECADLFLASMEGPWRNAKHRQQWCVALGGSYCKRLVSMGVSAMGTNDVLAMLTPSGRHRPRQLPGSVGAWSGYLIMLKCEVGDQTGARPFGAVICAPSSPAPSSHTVITRR